MNTLPVHCNPVRTYELSQDDCTIAYFRTEAEARHHACYMPAGRYRIMEFDVEGEYLTHRYGTNLCCELRT